MAVLTVKLCPFPVPLSVIQEVAPRLLPSSPVYRLPDLDAQVLSDLCDEFRCNAFHRANKPDPAAGVAAGSTGQVPPMFPDDSLKWAGNLIRQLPVDHDGRNSWLINYGHGADVEALRDKHSMCREKQ